MKILVAIPCLYNSHVVSESIKTFINHENVDVLVADNGAEQDVKEVIRYYQNLNNIQVISEPQNIFVNPIWNKFMKYFLDRPEYNHLIIANSDLLMQKDWSKVLMERLRVNPDEIPIPNITDNNQVLNQNVSHEIAKAQVVYEGTAGVFIILNRMQCDIVYPIPPDILIWFGDQYIYEILRVKYQTVIPENLIAYHLGSQTVSKLPGISELIEQDKVAWANIVNPLKSKLIDKLKL